MTRHVTSSTSRGSHATKWADARRYLQWEIIEFIGVDLLVLSS